MAIKMTYTEILIDLTRRDFKTRYLGSLLGSYWNIIHPLVMILIYTLVFSKVMRAKLGDQQIPFSYSLYLCSGLIPWTLFSEIVNRGSVTLLENATFLKKLSVPSYIFFGVTTLSAIINFFIAFGIFYIILIFIHPMAIASTLEYLSVVAFFVLFAMGLGISIGYLNVFMRDFQQITTVIFQLWFWFTPIVYALDALPQIAKDLLWFNPAFAFIEPLHQILFYQKQPPVIYWLLMIIWTLISLGSAYFIYKKTHKLMRDFI